MNSQFAFGTAESAIELHGNGVDRRDLARRHAVGYRPFQVAADHLEEAVSQFAFGQPEPVLLVAPEEAPVVPIGQNHEFLAADAVEILNVVPFPREAVRAVVEPIQGVPDMLHAEPLRAMFRMRRRVGDAFIVDLDSSVPIRPKRLLQPRGKRLRRKQRAECQQQNDVFHDVSLK